MTRAKIDWLLPTTPESLLMLDDPPEGVRPRWLAPGLTGQVLQIDSLGRLAWGTGPSTLPPTATADPGDVLTIVDGEPVWGPLPPPPVIPPDELPPPGGAGEVLTIVGGVPVWAPLPPDVGFANPMVGLGDLIRGGASGVPTRLPPGTNGHVLTLAGGIPAWQALVLPPDVGFANPMTQAADLIVGDTGGAAIRLGKGADAQVLTVVAGALAWATPAAGGMANPMTTLGDLIYGGGPAPDPAFVNAVANGAAVNGSSTTTTTVVITPGAGANFLVYVATNVAYFSTTPSIVSITAARAGGGTLTFTQRVAPTGPDPNKQLFIWGSPCVAGAAYTLTITWGGNLDIAQAVMAFSGVNGTTPLGTPVTDVDGGATGTAAVGAGAGNALILDTMTGGSTSVFTPGAGQTACYAAQAQATRALRSSVKLGSGTVGMSHVITNPPGDSSYAAIALLPEAGIAPGTPLRLGAGSAAQVLTMLGGVPTWSAPAGITFPILAPDGTVSAPSYAWASDPTTGFYRTASAGFIIALAGLAGVRFSQNANVTLRSDGAFRWAPSTDPTAVPDLLLLRDAAATLAQRNSTNPQTFRLYNTFTDASNGERLDISAGASQVSIRHIANGTGTPRSVVFQTADATGQAVVIGLTQNPMVALGAGAVATALANGRVDVGASWGNTSPSGQSVTLRLYEQFAPTVTSTMVAVPLYVRPTINYSNATPGAGSYEAVKITVVETALPTGQSYMIRASGGAAGTTDVFRVTNAGQVWAPDGSVTAPAFAIGSTSVGFFRPSAFDISFASASAERVRFSGAGGANPALILLAAGGGNILAAGAIATPDIFLARDAANTLALRNGTAVQTFRVYNTYTDGANYERVEIAATGAATYIQQVAVGSGVARPLWLNNNGAANLVFGVNSVARWSIIATVGHLQPNVDGAHDLGGGAARVRSLYLSEMLSMSVQTAPATPAAGRGSLYMKADKKLYFKDDAGLETALW